MEAIDPVLKRVMNIQNTRGVSTGIRELDRCIGGLLPGTVLIAARQALGKTSLALQFATHVSSSQNGVVAYFTLAQSKESIGSKLLTQASGISRMRLNSGKLGSNEWTKLAEGAQSVSNLNLHLSDSIGMSAERITEECRTLRATEGRLNLVIVDYLQLVSSRSPTIHKRSIDAMRQLKILSEEIGCPTIVLSQLDRGLESRKEKRPRFTDLSDLSDLEELADVILFIYRDDIYNLKSQDKDIAELIVARNRFGETGTIRLGWLGERMRFASLSPETTVEQLLSGSSGKHNLRR